MNSPQLKKKSIRIAVLDLIEECNYYIFIISKHEFTYNFKNLFQ